MTTTRIALPTLATTYAHASYVLRGQGLAKSTVTYPKTSLRTVRRAGWFCRGLAPINSVAHIDSAFYPVRNAANGLYRSTVVLRIAQCSRYKAIICSTIFIATPASTLPT